jgi:hypothetical protein
MYKVNLTDNMQFYEGWKFTSILAEPGMSSLISHLRIIFRHF